MDIIIPLIQSDGSANWINPRFITHITQNNRDRSEVWVSGVDVPMTVIAKPNEIVDLIQDAQREARA